MHAFCTCPADTYSDYEVEHRAKFLEPGKYTNGESSSTLCVL